METNFNIYERLENLEKEMFSLRLKVEHYESILQSDPLMKTEEDKNITGFYTINDILRKYNISRQCLYNYRMLVPLKKSTKIGRFDRFKKQNIVEFMNKIAELKRTKPELFKLPKLFEKRIRDSR
jgi:hypothetical protein